ncbi:hypothetical protein J1N35_021886 [Gossypium stocksii]|uniref:Reverse transcriptase domain-containing protein n=1 Tax=Gossypium stocksii TaxID=47602 RepID=A0A9D3VFD9_9ROSI|nr:hypothetical protein J1N35_021886 [Gossypium stocksii]
MGFLGPRFTWNRGNLFQRVDKALCNSKWKDFASNYSVRHLQRLKSYHRPILVAFRSENQCGGQRPFRFLASWLLYLEFRYLLNTHSRSDLEVDSNLDQLMAVLQKWNKVYGNIYTRKKDLVSELSIVQRILEVRRSSHLVSREAKIRGEIDDLLNHEELLWFQKSRTTWLENDDRNTKYFHGRTMNLYKAETPVIGTFSCRGMLPVISIYDREILNKTSMAHLKAPGIDGYHAKFYQSQWDIIGESVCSMVRKVLEGHRLDPKINKTLIVLIPKIQGPKIISQFRSINLCTILYKVITKNIVNRLHPIMESIVKRNQASFIAGRNISNNIIIAQKAIHTMKIIKGSNCWMALKRVTSLTFGFVVDKIHNKLSGWDAKNLSMAGRITLVKLILLVIPNYFMCKARLLLSASENRGLGIRILSFQNKVFLLKLCFDIIVEPDALWALVLRSKYNVKSLILFFISRGYCSLFWKSIMIIWPEVINNIYWSIGDGQLVNFWNDTWIRKIGPLKPFSKGIGQPDKMLRPYFPIVQKQEMIESVGNGQINKVLTNDEQARRHMIDEGHFPQCENLLESSIHTLHDYGFSRAANGCSRIDCPPKLPSSPLWRTPFVAIVQLRSYTRGTLIYCPNGLLILRNQINPFQGVTPKDLSITTVAVSFHRVNRPSSWCRSS